MKTFNVFWMMLFIPFFIFSQNPNLNSCFVQQVSSDDFVKLGKAKDLGNNCYSLTTTSPSYQFGGIWYQNKLSLDQDFSLEFELNFGTNDRGADGMAFTLQPINTSQGSNGGFLGFKGIDPSINIEFDDFQNHQFNDPSSDHISIQANGEAKHPTGYLDANVPYVTVPNLEDGTDKNVIIEWISSTTTLNVYFENVLITSVTQDVKNTIFGGDDGVYWGWTGATGFRKNNQKVCIKNVRFKEALELTASMNPTACSSSTGSIDLTVSPSGTYNYLWSNHATTEDIDNLSPDVYTVIVSSLDDCLRDTLSIEVTSENGLQAQIVPTGTCDVAEKVTNGALNNRTGWTTCASEISYTENVYGGTSTTNVVAEIDGTNSLCQTVNGLTIGKEYVFSFDASGRTHSCAPTVQNASVLIDNVLIGSIQRLGSNFSFVREYFTFTATSSSHSIKIITADALSYTCGMIIDNVSMKENCSQSPTCNETNGQLASTVTNGTLPYSYLWSSGATSPLLTNLTSGIYSLTVTDANGCTATDSYTLTDEVDQTPPSITCTPQTLQISTSQIASLDLSTIVVSDNCLLDTVFAPDMIFTCDDIGLVSTMTVTAVDASGNTSTCDLSFEVVDTLSNCSSDNCYSETPVTSIDCNSCSSIVPTTGWYQVASNDTACLIEKTNGGIHFAPSATLVVCGNVHLQGLNLGQGTKVIINGTLTVDHMNFNSNDAVLENYGTLIITNGLNLRGSFTNFGSLSVGQTFNANAPNGSFINNGTATINSDFNIYDLVENNASITVANNVHINSNATFTNNCTITCGNRFAINSQTNFTNDGSVVVADKFFVNNATFTLLPESIIEANSGDFSNSTANNPQTCCAFIQIADHTLFNQPIFDGDISYCDQNQAIEIDNNSTFTNGASPSCNSCSPTTPAITPMILLSVNPNPIVSGNQLHVNYTQGDYILHVVDFMGNVKTTQTVNQTDSYLNTSQLLPGTYILSITTLDGLMTESIRFDVL